MKKIAMYVYFLLFCTLNPHAGTAQSNNEGASVFDFDYNSD